MAQHITALSNILYTVIFALLFENCWWRFLFVSANG